MTTANVANKITSPDFFKGGKAVFTVSNPAGERYTYSIRRGKKSAQDLYFANLLKPGSLMSPAERVYLGIFNTTEVKVVPTYKSTFRPGDKVFDVLAWAVRAVAKGTVPYDKGYAVQHEGRCCRCAKALTDPESINLGIGPECRRKMGRS